MALGPPSRSLAGRVVRSGLWMVGVNVTGRSVGFVRLLVLAHLLTPHDFGLVGMALVVMSLYDAFSATGVQAALIHNQARARALLDTAWTIGVVRGVLTAGLLFLSAPLVGAFFGSPDGVPVIRAMAIVPLGFALQNIGVVEFRQELAYRSHYLLYTVGVVADLCVAVPLALWLGNAWAIVAGWAALIAARTGASYLLHPYRPRFHLDASSMRSLLGFGRWIFGTNACAWVLADGVSAVVGRFLGVTTLAIYQMGVRIAGLSIGEMTAASGVALGAFAKLQDTPDRLRQAYLRVLALVGLAAAPIACGLVLYAQALVGVVVGARWLAAVPVIQLLAIRGFLKSLGATTGPVFRGTGHPSRETLALLVELVPVATLLVPATLRIGSVGAALVALLGGACGASAALWMAARLLRLGAADLGSRLLWPLCACVPPVLVQLGLVGMPVTLAGLGVGLGVSAGLYGAALLALGWLGLYRPDPLVTGRLTLWWAMVRSGAGAR